MLDSGLQANHIPGHPVYQSPARAPTLPCSVPYHVRGKQPSSLPQANTAQDKAQAFKNQQKDIVCGFKGSEGVRGFFRFLLGKFLHFRGPALRILKLPMIIYSGQLHVMHPKESSIMTTWTPTWISQWNIPSWRTTLGHNLCHLLYHPFPLIPKPFKHFSPQAWSWFLRGPTESKQRQHTPPYKEAGYGH